MDFYDCHGHAFAYCEDGETIYAFSGQPIAYLHGDSIYAFSGVHLGFFEAGQIWNHAGEVILFTNGASGGPMKPLKSLKPLKGLKHLKPIKGLKAMKPLKSLKRMQWAQTDPEVFFKG